MFDWDEDCSKLYISKINTYMEEFEIKVLEIINDCINVSDIIKKLNITDNGYNYKKIRNVIDKFDLDISHFTKKKRKSKYEKIKKECPKCDNIFETISGGNDSRMFCSRKCANSRQWSDEDKLKKSISAKKSEKVKNANSKSRENVKKVRLCKYDSCDNTFTFKKNNKSKYCSKECVTKFWSEHHKKLYMDGKNHVAGGTTKWYDYGNIKVQGTYELRTCSILDKKKEKGIIYDWVYTNDRYDYVDIDGKKRTYLLDFKIYNTLNSFYYLETKGWVKDNDYLKWESVRKKGYRLDVWYLEDIKNEENVLNIKK